MNRGVLRGAFGAYFGVMAWFCAKIGDPVSFLTGGACCFRWVYSLGTHWDGTAVGNVTNIASISTPCSQRYTMSQPDAKIPD